MSRKEEIILGACDVYMYEFDGLEIPSNEVIETEDHDVGHTSGGASIEYKPTKYDVKNSYGKIVKSFITEEAVTAKTGLLSWKLSNLALLSTAKFTEDSDKATRSLTIGGGGSLKTILVRFVHTKENGKKIRFTMIGQGGNGFTVEFTDKELSIDAEINAIESIRNFLASFEEELTEDEVKALKGKQAEGDTPSEGTPSEEGGEA